MRKRLLLLLPFLFLSVFLTAQATIEGKVTDDTGEGLIAANIEVFRDGVFITGSDTDFDGNYVISGLEAGTYDVQISYVGYTTQRIEGVIVKADKANKVDALLTTGTVLTEFEVIGYKVPLVEQDNTTQGKTVTAENIRSLPTKDITGIAATSAGLSSNSAGDISVRGSRTDATFYYIDGIRVSGNNALIVQSEIEQLQIITGGIEAKYGDVTGGIISITSKGPSQRYSAGFEVETSEYLDDQGYNLLSGYAAGPILKNNDGQSVLGFRVSGQFLKADDRSPSPVGIYRMSEEQIAELEANPVSLFRGTEFATAQQLTEANLESTRPNVGTENLDLTAKLDARLTDNIDVTLAGSYLSRDGRFTPGSASQSAGTGGGAWSMLNWTNNPITQRQGYRFNARFRHKIGTQGFSAEGGEDAKQPPIRNAFYSLQAGVEKGFNNTEDFRHGDNPFRYGYFGNQARDFIPTATFVADTTGGGFPVDAPVELPGGGFLVHQGSAQVDGEFVADPNINPVLARYNTRNGFIDGPTSTVWNLYSNVGQVYNRITKGESDIYTFNLVSGFDFLPGGLEKGKHSVQLGFTYEQRINRTYTLAPQRLWEIMRLQANSHIIGVDYSQPIGTFLQNAPGLGETTFNQYQNLVSLQDGSKFIQAIRDQLQVPLTSFVNTDALNPDALSLDLFSAAQLNDQGLVNYAGFDFKGNKLPSSLTFDDFFNSNGSEPREFLVAPLKPIYWAGYIQDKFTYKDIIFRLGVRLDYFDNNTKVLRDPYALYEIESAADFVARTGQDIPDNIGDDYSVYVAGEDSDDIVGYRRGDEWFLSNGTSVSNGGVVFQNELVFPSFKGRDEGRILNIKDPEFDPNTSFVDYDPQLNIMPRLAFSFPISEDANFFAHYDVLVQRPQSGNGATALDYFYFNDAGRTPLVNSNLLPEKTIDYEVGFQQKISNNSALKISAFYKELRDLVQRRFYAFVASPVNQYESIGNLDFGTVKGFSFAYDMRRNGPIEVAATYTLQFADGTGSDVNSSSGINQRGLIRNLLPLSYDERHRFTGVIDYRYFKGEGPKLFDKPVFENMGANFILTAVSGRPYTSRPNPGQFTGTGFEGSLNGSRLPWNFNVDLRIDKSFSVKLSSSETARPLNCNVYLRLQNLFDIRSVVGVYNFTGDPEDDGYLASSQGRDQIDQINELGLDVNSFLSYYSWRLLAPGNYLLPRRVYLGATFDF